MSTTWVPALPTDSLGARLRLLRLTMDKTVEEMANLCGYPAPTWRTWERGASPHKMERVVKQISRATEVDMVWLMWGTSVTPAGGDDTPPDLPTGTSTWKVDALLADDERQAA